VQTQVDGGAGAGTRPHPRAAPRLARPRSRSRSRFRGPGRTPVDAAGLSLRPRPAASHLPHLLHLPHARGARRPLSAASLLPTASTARSLRARPRCRATRPPPPRGPPERPGWGWGVAGRVPFSRRTDTDAPQKEKQRRARDAGINGEVGARCALIGCRADGSFPRGGAPRALPKSRPDHAQGPPGPRPLHGPAGHAPSTLLLLCGLCTWQLQINVEMTVR
jgi:hypothetical protein